MSFKLIDLPWLPVPPEDWSERCKALAPEAADAGDQLRQLASYRLDTSKSMALRRAMSRLRKAGHGLAPLSGFKLGILSANTFDLVLDHLPAAAMRHGVALETVQLPYGMIMQPVLDPASQVYTSGLDAVLVAGDHRWLGLDTAVDGKAARSSVDQALRQIEDLLAMLRGNGGPPAIIQTLALPQSPLFGSLDAAVAGSVRSRIAQFNAEVAPLAQKHGAYAVDVAALAAHVGADDWFNPVQWAAYKLPFDAKVGGIYADWIGRVLGAIRGKSAKCLVLDLDNTLWGGVIGDDGMQGIVVGQGNARGEAHLAVQRAALELRGRGIFIAVASKNEDNIAREPFRSHPDMLLRETDIAVFQANWIDKASNLEAIARTLNIGLDSLVFLDDNPAERAQVRRSLPMVRVPELPEDPSWFAWMLNAGGWFEAVTFSAEDMERANMQAQDAQRAKVMTGARDLTEYLTALEMTASFAPFNEQGRQRITQLINKTNQFNLTTTRYTEAQVRAFEQDPSTFTLQVRLADRFGDLGMIAVVICKPLEGGSSAWNIDSWLMSCRVLGREVEAATLDVICRHAAERGVKRLLGTYIPTDKNALVAQHYAKLGFTQTATGDRGRTVWEFDVTAYPGKTLPMAMQVETD